MATQVNRSVNIFIQSGEAEKAHDRLLKKQKALNEELAKTTDPKRIKQLKSELDRLQEPIDRAGRKLRGELQPSFRDLQNTVNSLGRRLKQLSSSDADYSKILVQYQAAKVALQEQKKVIDQISSAQKNIGRQAGFGAFLGTLAGNLLGNAIGQLKSLGAQAIRTALETEGVRIAFNRLNQPNLLDQLRKATKGTVTDLELMKRAVAANNFQIPLERLGTLLEFAQRRARETGQSVDFLVDSIVTGIARKSPLILDNLGINIQRINAEFKNTGDFAKAAFNVVQEELDKAGPALETSADRWERWSANIQNALTQAGEGLLSIADNISDVIVFGLGSDMDRAEIIMREGQKKIAERLETARRLEISQVEDHRRRVNEADEAGRKDLFRIAELEIKNLRNLETFYLLQGRKENADEVGVRLKLWTDYYRQLTGINKDGNDTIANLQKEIQATTEIRDNAIIGSKQFNDAKDRLKELQERLDELLGRKKSSTKNKTENLFSRFSEQLKEQARELDLFNAIQIDKEINANTVKYDKLQRQLVESLKKKQLTEEQYGQLTLQLVELRNREENLIIQRWAQEANRRRIEEEKKTQAKLKELDKKRLTDLLAFQERLAQAAADAADKAYERKRFNAELDIITKTGKARLKAKEELLNIERSREIKNAEGVAATIEKINKKYDQLIIDAKVEHFAEMVNKYANFVAITSELLNQFFSAQNQRDQIQLDQERANNDRKKESYKRLLDNKSITQKEYDKKVQQLEKQQEDREKKARIREFNRNKISQLLSTSVTVARGIAEAFATPPVPNFFLAGLMAAVGAVQMGIIASTDPPKFGKGVLLKGPLHSEGGMPIVNPSTGKKVAEVEGGEAILSRNTVKNNPTLVSQLLDSSLNRNGAPIKPPQSYPSRINTGGISDAFNTIKRFETGGILELAKRTDSSTVDMSVMEELRIILDDLRQNGVTAYTLLSQNERQQLRKQAIKTDATLK